MSSIINRDLRFNLISYRGGPLFISFSLRTKRLSADKLTLAIISPSDLQQDLYLRLLWGDYWVKYELIKAFGETNCIVTNAEPDVVIHLFGFPTKLPKHAYKIAWIYKRKWK